VLSFGGAIKLTRYFGAGLNIGLIPTIRISLYGEAELSYQEYDIYGRIFPFGGMFFVGAGAGYATIAGSLRSSYDVRAYQKLAPGLPDELSVESEASVRTLVLTPQIGLQPHPLAGRRAGIGGTAVADGDHLDTDAGGGQARDSRPEPEGLVVRMCADGDQAGASGQIRIRSEAGGQPARLRGSATGHRRAGQPATVTLRHCQLRCPTIIPSLARSRSAWLCRT